MAINIFQKSADASASGGGNYVRDGLYVFGVEKIFVKDDNDVCFIAELRVLEAAQHPEYPDVKPNAVGSTVSFVQNFTKHDKTSPGNVKAFGVGLLGGAGYTEEQVTQELLAEICKAHNPMRGAKLKATTYRKTTKESKRVITLCNWYPVEGQTADTIKAGRASLDMAAAVPASAPAPTMPIAASVPIEPASAPAATPAPIAPKPSGTLAGLLG